MRACRISEVLMSVDFSGLIQAGGGLGSGAVIELAAPAFLGLDLQLDRGHVGSQTPQSCSAVEVKVIPILQ